MDKEEREKLDQHLSAYEQWQERKLQDEGLPPLKPPRPMELWERDLYEHSLRKELEPLLPGIELEVMEDGIVRCPAIREYYLDGGERMAR